LPRSFAYPILALASALPRLVAVGYERSDITNAYVDKGDDFARTFLDSGTYGFIPGVPSAYTQPLYGFFLIPLYWIAERNWLVIGIAHVLVAVATALLVYELGRRVADTRVALVAALLTTLHPYVVWHDVHMNREILDQLLAVTAVLLTLVVAEGRNLAGSKVLLASGALGLTLGLMVLGNVRTLFIPLVLAAYIVWRRGWVLAPAVALGVAVLVVSPWVVRNDVSVGCFAITTDARALWKANNEHTLETLRAGKWIDDVPLEGTPLSPQDAHAIYERTGRVVRVDECAQMRFYREKAFDFMREHPGEKAKLGAYGAKLLWQPWVFQTEGRPGKGTWLDLGRSIAEPVFMVLVYAFALYGLTLLPRHFLVLTLALLAYQTVMAILFVGATRYRVPWDFLVMIPAAAGAVRLLQLVPATRASARPGQ
jgi:4-amino-4-deoxy-L-arabinose transferase-like glycosyltransferase